MLKQNPSFPLSSVVIPTILPGNFFIKNCFTAIKPRYGPPKLFGIPKDCPSPTTISAPKSPGDFEYR